MCVCERERVREREREREKARALRGGFLLMITFYLFYSELLLLDLLLLMYATYNYCTVVNLIKSAKLGGFVKVCFVLVEFHSISTFIAVCLCTVC